MRVGKEENKLKFRKHPVRWDSFDGIIADLGIDERTTDGVLLKRIRKALKDNSAESFIVVFSNVIALNLLIERELTRKLIEKGSLVNDDGSLNPKFSKDLLKLRGDTLKYMKLLQSMQAQSPNSEVDISSLLNDAD